MIRALLAFGLVFFLPGYSLDILIFPRQTILERIVYSFAFSMMIDVLVAFLLGANPTMRSLTGGFALVSIVTALTAITAINLIVYVLRRLL